MRCFLLNILHKTKNFSMRILFRRLDLYTLYLLLWNIDFKGFICDENVIISSLTKLANLVLKAGEVVEQISSFANLEIFLRMVRKWSSSSKLEICKTRDFSSYGTITAMDAEYQKESSNI